MPGFQPALHGAVEGRRGHVIAANEDPPRQTRSAEGGAIPPAVHVGAPPSVGGGGGGGIPVVVAVAVVAVATTAVVVRWLSVVDHVRPLPHPLRLVEYVVRVPGEPRRQLPPHRRVDGIDVPPVPFKGTLQYRHAAKLAPVRRVRRLHPRREADVVDGVFRRVPAVRRRIAEAPFSSFYYSYPAPAPALTVQYQYRIEDRRGRRESVVNAPDGPAGQRR